MNRRSSRKTERTSQEQDEEESDFILQQVESAKWRGESVEVVALNMATVDSVRTRETAILGRERLIFSECVRAI